MTDDPKRSGREPAPPSQDPMAQLRQYFLTKEELPGLVLSETDVQRLVPSEEDLKAAFGLAPFVRSGPSAAALRQRRYRQRQRLLKGGK